jgi:hypothetical protein
MNLVVILVVAVVLLGIFEVAVWLAAADSTDGFDSQEWEKRQTWRR